MRTPSKLGSPINVLANLFPNSICTSSIKFLGTITLLTAVHFCPAFTVISFVTSLTNNSNSGVPGTASGPNTLAFNESASKLNGTDSDITLGCAFNFIPVDAEPVKVTTS